jgi:N-acetylmuramoyl-L-alanine amidase
MELGWDRFIKMIKKELDALNGKATTASDSKPSNTTTNNSSNTLTGSNFMVRIKVDSLNIRKSASLSATVMGTVKKGQVYTITKVTNGMGCLKSGAGWISMGTKYVEKISSVSSTSASNTEYKVKITANVLNVRAGAGATYKINTTVKKNQVFTITETKNGWGKLKSGAGWIDLSYATKL